MIPVDVPASQGPAVTPESSHPVGVLGAVLRDGYGWLRE